MHMTLRRLADIRTHAAAPTAGDAEAEALQRAVDLRRSERGRSKLARRLTRKVALGRSGAF